MLGVVLRLSFSECLRHLRQPAFYITVAGVAALAWFSAEIGTSDLLARRQSYAAQLADLAREQVRPRATLTGSVVEPVLRAIRPPELGSLVARGEDLSVPTYVDFGPAGTAAARSAASDTAQLETGTLFDLESIVRVLGGFLAVLLGVESLGSARASGLMKAWDALGVSPAVFSAGRLLGCGVLMTFATTVVLGAAFACASLRLPGEMRSVLAVYAVSLLSIVPYLAAFIALGGACALWLRTRAAAFVAGVTLWIVAAMVWPQFVEVAARAASPSVLRTSMEDERNHLFADEILAGEAAVGEALFQRVGPATSGVTSDAVPSYLTELNAVWFEHAQAARAAARELDEQWQNDQARQGAFNRLGMVSPSTMLLQSVAELVGTGSELTRRWQRAAESHQHDLEALLFDDRPQFIARVPSEQMRQLIRVNRHDGSHWQDLPAFSAPPSSPGEPWRSAAAPLAILLGHFAVAVAAVGFGARRLEL